MAAAVLNTINTRLDAALIAFQLDHGEAKALIVDREYAKLAKGALALARQKPLVVSYDDPEFSGPGERLGDIDYEQLLAGGDADFAWRMLVLFTPIPRTSPVGCAKSRAVAHPTKSTSFADTTNHPAGICGRFRDHA